MFKQIIGNSLIKHRLQKAVSAPGHAYILIGEAGMGKFALAKAFAKALQCENFTDDACGICLSCKVFESGNHPDVLYVQASKTKAIGVEDIRSQLILPMSEKPFRYQYKVFIINQPLTPQAQNALLKTIEEPASFGIFLFLTESERLLLPTVLSRCVSLKLKPLTEEEIAQSLGISPTDPAIKFANGNPGRAKDLLNSENFVAMQGLATSVSVNITNMDMVEVFGLYSKFDKWRESIQTLLDILYMQYAHSSQPQLKGLDAISSAKKALHQNGNFQMTIELMLLQMSGAA